ncbi:MAG: hypothetical protein KI790_06780 [Cyclobacteriaceae bacterium]|nr:hypothetical protein [Cyclobacteriaceae bacterium HetDA_MAG_MS6]
MNTTKILTIVFGITSVLLAIYLYSSINSSIEETKRIAQMEQDIIDKLMMIRDAQIAYQAVNSQYTSDWDQLLNFVDSGSFYLTERTETIITLDYGADSTYVQIDTLGTVAVKDSIFNSAKFPNFQLADLPYVPGVEPPTKFDMWADKINKSGVLVDVVEVKNPKPINPDRDEESEYNTRKPLRFGSRTSVTTAGNWE